MTDQNQTQDANEDDDAVACILANLHSGGVDRELRGFIAHMRHVIPTFAEDVDHALLRIVFCAGREAALRYQRDHSAHLAEAGTRITAMALADFSEKHNIDPAEMNANLDRYNERKAQREGQPQGAPT